MRSDTARHRPALHSVHAATAWWCSRTVMPSCPAPDHSRINSRRPGRNKEKGRYQTPTVSRRSVGFNRSKYPQESRRSFSQLIRHPSSFEQAATQVLDLRSLRRPGPTIQETRTLACADSLSRKRKQCPERVVSVCPRRMVGDIRKASKATI